MNKFYLPCAFDVCIQLGYGLISEIKHCLFFHRKAVKI